MTTRFFCLTLILTITFSCSSSNSLLTREALIAYNEGKYLTSLFFAEQAILKNPNDKDAFIVAIKSHLKLEEFDKAEEKLNQIIKLYDDPELIYLKSQIKLSQSDYENAILDLKEYINKKGDLANPSAYFNLAFCYFQIGEYELALRTYLKYSSLDPLNKDSYLNIAYLYGYLGNSDSAIAFYNKILAIDSTNYNALYNRSIEYQIQNNFKQALRDLENLVELYPNDISVLMDLAKLRIKDKKYFSAINDLTKVIKIDSTQVEAFFLRGKCFLELSRTFSACVDFIKAGELGYFEAYEMIKIYCKKNK